MRPAYKQHVREFVKGGRAALVNHSLAEGLRLKDTRNRPSGNPNCELFPQGPIISVPPSTPPYRPVGICGNNWAVSPYRDAKRKPPNQRVRRPLFPLFRAYRTKSVSGPIIHSFRNGYLVLWWSSSHTRPSPHFSGREASSALMPYRSLSRSTSASVGISRSVSAIVFGHSTCR